tara:strand:- start:2033 stop:2944 length:912 start_codon:yes stop_codon:yes gene_type:complete
MLIEYNDHLNYLRKIRSGEVRTGAKLGLPKIDEHFRFKPSNFNIILGHANVGKTSIALYLMLLYSVLHKKRWLVYSSENEPYSLIRKMIEFLEKKPINKISEEGFTRSSRFVDRYFKFVDNQKMYTYKDLIELGEAIKGAWDYDGLFVDPYNSLKKDPVLLKSVGGHEYDYQACTEFRIFCKKYGVTVWLNTHANTEALRKKHSAFEDYAGHPIPPMASDVEGGGKFVNRADDFMVIHRYVQHPSEYMYCHIHIRKVKEIETGGRPTSLSDPIKLKALPNNVGYTLADEDMLQAVRTPENLPF